MLTITILMGREVETPAGPVALNMTHLMRWEEKSTAVRSVEYDDGTKKHEVATAHRALELARDMAHELGTRGWVPLVIAVQPGTDGGARWLWCADMHLYRMAELERAPVNWRACMRAARGDFGMLPDGSYPDVAIGECYLFNGPGAWFARQPVRVWADPASMAEQIGATIATSGGVLDYGKDPEAGEALRMMRAIGESIGKEPN